MMSPRQDGISLVEFMVAMTVGLFLIAGVGATYLGNKGAFSEGRAVSVMQDNGRFSLETLSRDIRLAGFSGCMGAGNVSNKLNNSGNFLYNFGQALQGFHGSGSTWSPSLDAAIGGGVTPLAGTDVLTLRRAEGASYGLSAPSMAASTDAPHVDASLLAPDKLQQNQFVLVGDCTAAAVFQITNADAITSGLLRHAAGAGSPGNASADLGRAFGADAQATRMVTASYFLAPSAAVPGRNSLWQQTDGAAAVEMALGVDNLQILFGEDTDGDMTANRYVTADLVSNMAGVVSLRLSLLISSDDNVAQASQPYTFNGVVVTPTDRRLRTVFTTVVNLRNRTP